MQAKQTIIDTLNNVLTSGLTSINRYFLHARMYKNWGFDNLDTSSYKKSINDMKQMDDLIGRILFLEGLPNLQKLDALHIGEHTEEMLACDMKFQITYVAQLKKAISLLEQEQDYISRSLLENILSREEEYIDWIETQQHQIGQMNLQNYLQAQISDD